MPIQTLLLLSNIHNLLIYFLFAYVILLSPFHVTAIQSLPPSPSEPPFSFDRGNSVYVKHSPPAPAKSGSHGSLASASAPAPERVEWHEGTAETPSSQVAEKTVRWCTLREEHEACMHFIDVVKRFLGYSWKCVNKYTTQECMDSIKKGEADMVNVEAGLAYIALMNYSMKAIANEIYCDQAKYYEAVAVVNREACEKNNMIGILDFKDRKSCHGGYSTATGWNYPLNYIRNSFDTVDISYEETARKFFSGVCAPSEISGSGMCDGCVQENGSCTWDGLYTCYSGAFRC